MHITLLLTGLPRAPAPRCSAGSLAMNPSMREFIRANLEDTRRRLGVERHMPYLNNSEIKKSPGRGSFLSRDVAAQFFVTDIVF